MALRSSGPRPIASRSRVVAGCEAPQHAVVSDRIRGRTFVIAPPVHARRVTLRKCPSATSTPLPAVTAEMGVSVSCGNRHRRGGRDATDLRPFRCADIETQPYPGLATDSAPRAVLLTQAKATATSPRRFSRTASSGSARAPPEWAPRSRSWTRTTPPSTARHAPRRDVENRRSPGRRVPYPGALAADGVTTISRARPRTPRL